MTKQQLGQLGSLQGRRVNLALGDGSRIDDCQLVSTGFGRLATLWVFINGVDVFVRVEDITDVWEAPARPSLAGR